MCAVIDWNGSSLEDQSSLLEELKRDAALFVRDKLLAQDLDDPQCVFMRQSSIAWCVWNCDLKLFRSLISHSDLAKQHLVLENGVPAVSDFEKG